MLSGIIDLHRLCEFAFLSASACQWRFFSTRRFVWHRQCPAGECATFVHRHVTYDGYKPACTACTCGASGGACYGTLRAYKDDTCSTNEDLTHIVFSDMPNCTNLPPSGNSFGSKEFTDLTYVPGACEPKGGEPVGDVVPIKTQIMPDGDVEETVTTWCCLLHDGEKSSEE